MTSCCRSSLLKTPFLWPLLMVQATVGTFSPMMSVFVACLLTLKSCAQSRAALQLEVLALRHQLQVLERSRPPRLRLTRADRLLWGCNLAPLEELAPLAQAVGAVAPRPIAVAPGAVTGMPSSSPVPRTRSHAGLPDVTGYTPAQVEAAIGPPTTKQAARRGVATGLTRPPAAIPACISSTGLRR